MSMNFAPYLEHIRPLQKGDVIPVFIKLFTMQERLTLVWEVLEMAGRNREEFISFAALASLVERQLYELECLRRDMCPGMDEIAEKEDA